MPNSSLPERPLSPSFKDRKESNRDIRRITITRYGQPEKSPKTEISLAAIATLNHTRRADSSRLRGVSWRLQKMVRLGT